MPDLLGVNYMNMLEKIDLLMKQKGIKRAELSRGSRIPYTTICGFYEKGTSPKRSTLLKLATYFECSIDYLANDNFEEPAYAPLDDVFTIPEASEIWGTTDAIIKQYIKDGQFLSSESRLSSREWLVTRQGMQIIFGNPLIKPSINMGKPRL